MSILVPRRKHRNFVAEPTTAKECLDLCGWGGAAIAMNEWDRIGDQFAAPVVTGARPGDDGAGGTVRGWDIFRKVTGKEPDLTPQPTGNCVAAAADDIVELTQAVQIAAGDVARFEEIYNPFHYATGRVLIGRNQLRGGAGSVGSWQAKALEQYGGVALATPNLPDYTKANVDAWGDDRSAGGVSFREFLEIGGKTIVKTTARVTSWPQLRAMLNQFKFATIASNRGYAMSPDRDGFHRPSGTWSHQISVQGYSESNAIRGREWVGLKNQWGDRHGHLVDFETDEAWPYGYLRVRLDDFVKYHLGMSGCECIVYSGFEGFPALELDLGGFA